MKKNHKIYVTIISVIIVVIVLSITFLSPKYSSAFELKEIADEIAYEWADNATLNRISSYGGDVNREGNSTAWAYSYSAYFTSYDNDSMGKKAVKGMTVTIYTNEKILQINGSTIYEDDNFFPSNQEQLPFNLTMDSDEAFDIALTDHDFNLFLDKLPDAKISMDNHASQQGWGIQAGVTYGPDLGPNRNYARMFINETSGEIEYKEIDYQGRSWYYVCTICPILGFIIFILLILYLDNRRKKKKAINFEVRRSEQGGFPQEIGPAEERKGGCLGKPD